MGPAYLKGPPGTPYGGALIGNVGNTSTFALQRYPTAVISGHTDVLLQKVCCAAGVNCRHVCESALRAAPCTVIQMSRAHRTQLPTTTTTLRGCTMRQAAF